jgi:prepilin-type N-terminal cleavage/methylation domain-containing protein
MVMSTPRRIDPTTRRADARPAFTLIEVLMAIFILGIGAISIAALFPAGIVQQRRSVDDVIGPVVANNALAILRNKLGQEDFGSFEEFTPAAGPTLFAPRPTVEGDWTWLRPSHLIEDNQATDLVNERGALDIFSRDWFSSTSAAKATEFPGVYTDPAGTRASPDLYGLPFNRSRYGAVPPRMIITQRERYYPMMADSSGRPARPQYVWDCMFRRHQGRVLVAIFVYRVNMPGGEARAYHVPANPSNPELPPLPIWLQIADPSNVDPGWDVFGDDDIAGTADDAVVLGTDECDEYDPYDQAQSWQEAGQWILDQNNNLHRVLSSSCNEDEDRIDVELVRAVPAMSRLPVNYVLNPSNPGSDGFENVVSDIWYIPLMVVAEDEREYLLTPIFATVKEL